LPSGAVGEEGFVGPVDQVAALHLGGDLVFAVQDLEPFPARINLCPRFSTST